MKKEYQTYLIMVAIAFAVMFVVYHSETLLEVVKPSA